MPTQAGFFKMQPVFRNITRLKLVGVSKRNMLHMACAARCCPSLSAVVVRLKAEQLEFGQEGALVRRFWHLLTDNYSPLNDIREQLRLVHVTTHDDHVLLHMDAPDGQDPGNSLACMTAGSLEVLSGLARAAPAELRAVDETAQGLARKAQADAAMLRLMPALKWLDIGDRPFHAPFHGTVQGRLSHETAETFRNASVVHCTGLAEEAIYAQHIAPIDSIQSWTSIPGQWRDSMVLASLAPKLETLNIRIDTACFPDEAPPASLINLGPALKSVDVTFDVPGGGDLLVKGEPSKDLVHMRLDSPCINLQKTLYERLQARQQQPLVYAEHTVQGADDHEQKTIFLEQVNQQDKLVLRFDACMT
ncbi:hypothetical protein ABBQ38_015001 [Trebouxia sp. C0009 RCD-2024]